MLRLKRAQGMTEYIIIVGLIAILLIAAVKRYKETVRVTIEGGTTQVNGISGDIGGGTRPPADNGGGGIRPPNENDDG
jgi:Flp pilus assembly pilin Flp